MHAEDPTGTRAAAAAQLISSCGKRELNNITKSQILQLVNNDELSLFAQMHLQPGSDKSVCRQMLGLMGVPPRCVLGPVSFATFKEMFRSSCASQANPRYTWIVIVRQEPRTIAAEEPTSPVPPIAPECPATGPQPYQTQFDAFMEEAEAGTTAEAVHTDLPRVLQPHHFVVAWRRKEDVMLAPSLTAQTDFRTHGQPSPAMHQLPPFTPGLPQGASAFEVLRSA